MTTTTQKLITICMYCKKIIRVTTATNVNPGDQSHGICDKCLEIHYPRYSMKFKTERVFV